VAKTPYDDYAKELAFQRSAWERKAALRLQYHHWYRMIVAALAPHEPVVEIGAGCGNFKAYYPSCVAVDVCRGGPWIDRVMDAQALDFRAGEVGNLVAVDVLHHLQRPLEFLRRAEGVLRPGGRLVLCEPAATPWARLVYGLAHHERLDLAWPLFALDGTPPEPDPGHTFANIATPEILFWRERSRTLSALPRLRLVVARKFGFLLYPLTGGFSYRCFVPALGLPGLLRVEDFLFSPFASWLTGLRMLMVFEKRDSPA
jgi:SAM-dependent methyltransferase